MGLSTDKLRFKGSHSSSAFFKGVKMPGTQSWIVGIEKVWLFDWQQTFRTSFYITSSQHGLNKYWFTDIFEQW